MRALAALLVVTLGAASLSPAQAQAIEPGLYEGTIGTLPIRACFDDSTQVAGTYYYLKHLKPIGLGKGEDGSPAALVETLGYEKPTGGKWTALRRAGTIITGQWRDGKRRLPIRLKSVPYTAGEYAGPCEATEFQGPRMAGSSVSESLSEMGGEQLTILTFTPGPAFDQEAVEIASFAITRPVQPGDSTINAALREVLPASSGDSDFLQCLGMMHLAWGTDGEFSHLAQAEVLSSRWLGVLHTNGVYCGGAHPSFWQNRQIFDRETGREIDPSGWFKADALGFYEVESEEPGRAKRPVAGLSDGLHALVRKHWPSEDSECTSVLDDRLPGWDIGLGQGGMTFRPELPHALTACAESVTVPWSELEPYLSAAGRAVRDSLR